MFIRLEKELHGRRALQRNLLWMIVFFLRMMTNPLEGQNHFNSFKIDHWDTKKGLPNEKVELLNC